MRKFYQQMLIALLAMFPVGAWAQTTFTQGDFTYTVTDEDAKTVSIAKAEAATLTGALVIPTSVTESGETYAVTSIADYAFQGQSITSVTIPSSIMSIDSWAFRDCFSLTNISIEDSENPLSMVAGYWSPFSANNAYTYITERSVYIGRNLTLSETSSVFDAITSVEFGPNVTTINSYLFSQAAKLSSVTIGNGVTTIGDYAFQEAGTSVEEMVVTMGNGVTSIGVQAFYYCSHLKAVTLPSSLTEIKAYAFQSTGLTRITIPASVTNIREWAFRDCNSLTNIRIEDSENALSMIAGYYSPFSSNNATTYISERNVYIGRNLTLSETSSVFDGITSVEFGPNVTTISQSMFYQATNLSSATIGSGVTTIGDQAFRGCSKLTSVNIREGVTRIGEQAFHSTGLTSVTIPASVMTIGNEAFNFINALESVTIADSETPLTLENNYYGAFQNGDGNGINYYTRTIYIGRNIVNSTGRARTDFDTAEDVIIGPKVTTINESMFNGCQHLRSVVIGDGVTSIGDNAFYNCGTFVGGEGHEEATVDKLTVTMGKNVKTIGDGAFVYCSKLTSIEIPNGVTRIGADAFNNSGLTSVTIPASVETIGNQAFNFINSLESVTIADGDTPLTLENTYYGAFQNGDAGGTRYTKTVYLGRDINNFENRERTDFDTVEELTIGPKVTTLRPYMFAGCYGLQSVDMTNATSLTSISEYAFANITGITSVKVPWLTPITINENVFASGAYSSAILSVPAGTKEAYAAASIWENFTNIDHWSTLVTLTASTHGSIVTAEATASNGTEQYRQPKNDDIVYTLTADTGYELTALTDNEEAVSLLPALDAEQTRANTEGEEFVTLVATFKAINYSIEYELAGGTVATANPTSYTIESAAITLVNPTREGYTFAGWTGTGLDAAATTVTIPAGSTGDRTYTATWTPIEYTISYDLAEGSVAEANPTKYTIESAAITLNNPTKTGYTFKGWTGTGLVEPTMEVTIANGSMGNKAYTATWQINQYTISFNSNGGTEVDPITQDYNTAVTAPAAPTRTGYTFDGWSPAVPATIPAENITLLAQWTINQYTITFDTKGGSTIDPIKQDYNSAVTAPAAPTKKGYSFEGWTPAVPTTMPAENKTLTATWNLVTYNITYNLAGGTVATANPTSYNVESAAITLNNPTKTGFDFAGWTGTGLEAATKNVVIATGSTDDRSYTATWTKQKFTVNITGGNVTADNLNPEYGDNVVLTILEDEDAELLKLTVDGADVTASISEGKYTITNVTANVEVVATWNKTKEFIIMAHSQATFSCTQDLDFTGVSGLKVYIASGFNKTTGKVLMTQIEGKVPAGTGLFLEGTEGETYRVPYTTSCDAYYVSLLKPVATAQVVPTAEGAYTNFLYGEKEGVKGFYKSSGSGTVAAGKAYLQLPTSAVAEVKGIGFEFDDETSISSVKADMVAPEGAFDIHGRKIPAGQKLTRGMYIINGKKVSIK
jgi:uncharacterized repeat protein (TIGR02543 family)